MGGLPISPPSKAIMSFSISSLVRRFSKMWGWGTISVATAWSDEHTGQQGFILIMHEVLFFGNDLDHSLINPNQIRHNGFQLFDNPYETDPNHQMGIVIKETDCIPFQSQGTTIFFTSRFPTNIEIETYPHVVLTCEAPWDPLGIAMPGGLIQD